MFLKMLEASFKGERLALNRKAFGLGVAITINEPKVDFVEEVYLAKSLTTPAQLRRITLLWLSCNLVMPFLSSLATSWKSTRMLLN